MIKLISSKVACYLCSDEKDKRNYDLYDYAVNIVLSAILNIVTVIILGLCFNLIAESMLFYFSFIAIRKFAGGYHAKTPTRCYVFSVTVTLLVLVLIRMAIVYNSPLVKYGVLFLAFICLIVICILSPLDTENNPLNNKEKNVYKKIAIIISILLFITATILVILADITFGVPIGLGIIMAALVLVMRKVQMNFWGKIVK